MNEEKEYWLTFDKKKLDINTLSINQLRSILKYIIRLRRTEIEEDFKRRINKHIKLKI